MNLKTYTALLLALLYYSFVQSQTIVTIAGNGSYNYSGDGGPALQAGLGDLYFTQPAIDMAGNVYFGVGGASNVIRKIDKATGIISVVAGQLGNLGNSGNGGPAINAQIYHPTYMKFDKNGNLYFADSNSDILRKIDASGIITQVSGSSMSIPACGTGNGGPLLLAQFTEINGICFDNNGNMFICDRYCCDIRKIGTNGIINTIAGDYTSGYSGDDGPAAAARLNSPMSGCADAAGNYYFADARNNRVRKISTTGIITTIAGNGVEGYTGDGGPAVNASINLPTSVVVDKAGNVYFACYWDNVIRKVDVSGIITTFAGTGVGGYSGDGGPANKAQITLYDAWLAIDHEDNIYFCDDRNKVIRKIINCNYATVNSSPADTTLCITGSPFFNAGITGATQISWQENNGSGWQTITDNATYTGTTTNRLNISTADVTQNGYQYRCVATNGCGDNFTLPATLRVTVPVKPTIAVTTKDSSCEGETVVFTATTTTAGATPTYQWWKNGVPAGTSGNTYSDNTLQNNDEIYCTLTSSATCITTSYAKSDVLKVKVRENLTPLVTITPSANNVCNGTGVDFTATVTDSGTPPDYQWFKNGVAVGNNTAAYNDILLKQGDIISCSITTTYSCTAQPVVKSNEITMTIKPLLTPSVSIAAPTPTICPETDVLLKATIVNGGNAPQYQWKRNGLITGNNSREFTAKKVNANDVFQCSIRSDEICVTTADAISNILSMALFPQPQVQLDKTSFLCTNSYRFLQAGNFTSYVWNDGSTASSLRINNTGVYYVTVTDNNNCKGSDTTEVTQMLPMPSGFMPPDTSICSYGSLNLVAVRGYTQYLWNNDYTGVVNTVTQPGSYWLEVTDADGCKGRDTVVVALRKCITGFYMPTGFTPNNDGKNDQLRPLLFGDIAYYHFVVYNRFGQAVFESNDAAKGWDGTLKGSKQDGNTFVWICTYQLKGEKRETQKGTVALLR